MPKVNEDENKTKDEMWSDNDFAERFFKIVVNGLAMATLLIILSITLFWGNPDLVDNMSKAIGGKCQ